MVESAEIEPWILRVKCKVIHRLSMVQAVGALTSSLFKGQLYFALKIIVRTKRREMTGQYLVANARCVLGGQGGVFLLWGKPGNVRKRREETV